MKHSLLILFILFTVLSCSNNDTPSQSQSENSEVEVKEETDKDVVEFTDDQKESEDTTEASTDFELILPDTAKLFQSWIDKEYPSSMGYFYLTEFYQTISDKDSIVYYGDGQDYICHFYQEFEHGISYMKSNCSEEGGAQERITFPLVDSKLAKEFVNTVFFEPSNIWITDLKYEADGAGCYYTIIQTTSETIIDIWCGC